MNRRSLLGLVAAGALTPRQMAADAQAAKAARGLPSPKIKDVQVIATAPDGVRLVVVKILTDQDGLYGYGCATFTQRAELVVTAVEKYLKPFLIGKPADRIDDIWQAMYNSSYWRNGPVLNNAISGVDQALWDIKGRQCGMPVYQLLGGKCREAVDCYSHASGADIPQLIDSVRKLHGEGIPQHARAGRRARHGGVRRRRGRRQGRKAPRRAGLRARSLLPAPRLKMFEDVRKELGDEVELLHDMHERVSPTQAVQFRQGRRALPPLLPGGRRSRPRTSITSAMIRQQCATPHRHGRALQQPARVDAR